MHPVLQGLFDTMLEERLKNIECAPSYELYDIDGDIGALGRSLEKNCDERGLL